VLIKAMILKVKKLNPEAKLPAYAYSSDAGMNLYSTEEVTLNPGQVGRIKTGIAIEIPEGYVGLCWDRSGLSTNHSLKTVAGVIDAGYRGEILVGMINLGKEAYIFHSGDKIAQMIIQKIENPEIVEVAELSETARGEGGFGSTGKK
jgi:dUTP pyrophosphatase